MYNDRPFYNQRSMIMATKPATHKRSAPVVKERQAPIVEARRTIEEQTALFLKAGGSINKIPQGVSGQLNLTNHKQIVISKKPSEKNGS